MNCVIFNPAFEEFCREQRAKILEIKNRINDANKDLESSDVIHVILLLNKRTIN